MMKEGIFLTDSGTVYTGSQNRKRRCKRYVHGKPAESTALFLLIAAAAAVCFYFAAGYRNHSATSAVMETEMEQESAGPDFKLLPVQTKGMCSGSELLGGHYIYYAGPTESAVKEPEAIRIALDPGHGGVDDGCVKGGVLEKELNLFIAVGVKERLEAMGYQVVLTRDSDCALSLRERVKLAKEAHADIYVSIHQNSSELSGVNGMELYYSVQNAGDDSRRLAELIQNHAVKDTGASARAIFEWEELYVVRESAMPSCLIETGFLTNSRERNRLKTSEYQSRIAEGIATGIDRYFRPESEDAI